MLNQSDQTENTNRIIACPTGRQFPPFGLVGEKILAFCGVFLSGLFPSAGTVSQKTITVKKSGVRFQLASDPLDFGIYRVAGAVKAGEIAYEDGGGIGRRKRCMP